MALLVHGPIELERLLAEAARPDCGAVAVFLGTIRDHHEGRRVIRLEYDAYEPMTLSALERIERDAVERHAVVSCRIVHRLGAVSPAETSVAVIATAEHRGPAFDACRWAIDELKRTAPLWKKEYYEDGGGEWAEGTKLSG